MTIRHLPARRLARALPALSLGAALLAALAADPAGAAPPKRATPPPPLRIIHVTVIDGTGRPPLPDRSILIRAGRIAEISATPPQAGESVLDGRGGYALPGLIDAHTHLASIPGSVYRGDSARTRDCLWTFHMHAYLAAGVTAVLDNAAGPGAARKMDAYAAAGGVGPRTYYLAPFFTPRGGYFAGPPLRTESYADLWAPVDSPADVAARFDAAAGLHPVGAKVAIETGFGPFAVWNEFPDDVREAIRAQAARRGVPLFIHSMSNAAHRTALGMHPRALVHAIFLHEAPAPGVLEALRAQRPYMVSTVGVFDFQQLQWRPEALDDPLLRLTVPALERATARDPAAWRFQNESVALANSPSWLPDFLVRWGGAWLYGRRFLADELAAAQRNLKQLHDAGIPIVLGSDSGNWPVFVSGFHGPSTIRELELIVQAGIPPLEAVRAATLRAAEMIGVADELGSLEPGKRADLILLPTDPLQDVRAFRRVAWVVKDGVARRPAEWMAGAPVCR
jgi:imidazolonepropionase-like amidohydrolase